MQSRDPKLKRTHKLVITLNDYEADAFDNFCKKHKVKSTTKVAREIIINQVKHLSLLKCKLAKSALQIQMSQFAFLFQDPKTKVSDGSEVYSNTTGNSALATAGAGDILAGMIGAIINNDDYTFRAVNTAVYLHGKAFSEKYFCLPLTDRREKRNLPD